MIGRGIAYVAAVSRDVGLAAELLGEGLGLARTDLPLAGRGAAVPVFALGESALALFGIGDPFVGGTDRTGIDHIAIACPDPRAAARAAAERGVTADPAGPGPAPGGGECVPLDPAATIGVRTRLCPPLAIERAGSGLVERFDHVGIATDDETSTVTCFVERLGFAVESRQTDAEVEIALESFTSDRYGSVHHARPPRQVGGGRVVFITIGDTELEVLEPFGLARDPSVEHGRPGDTRQDMSALTRFVGKRGPGLHHVALKVADTDAALARVRAAGGKVIDTVARPGSRRARIGFVHPASLGGVLVHFGERADPLRD